MVYLLFVNYLNYYLISNFKIIHKPTNQQTNYLNKQANRIFTETIVNVAYPINNLV